MSWMGKREMSRSWFCYSPENDTWLAFLSLMAMTLIYFSNANFGYDHPVIFFVGFIFKAGNTPLHMAVERGYHFAIFILSMHWAIQFEAKNNVRILLFLLTEN